MTGSVSVDKKSVVGGINVCKLSIESLESSASRLENEYEQAGKDGWRDNKYRDLGILITQCTSSLKKPVTELNECMDKLRALLKEIEQYEEIRIV